MKNKFKCFLQAFSKCTAEVDPMVIASIPDVPQCIASLKEDFQVGAEYSAETGKFLVEGTFEQVACTQLRLQEILLQQLEIQKHQLRRLSGRGSQRHDCQVTGDRDWSESGRQHPITGQHYPSQGQDWSGAGQRRPITSQYGGGTVNHGSDWSEAGRHRPITSQYGGGTADRGRDWSESGQYHPISSQYGGVAVDHGRDWSESGQHHPITAHHHYPGYPHPPSHWTEPQYPGAATAAASSDYQRTPSYEGQSTSLCSLRVLDF